MIITPAMARTRTDGRRALLAAVATTSQADVAASVGVHPSCVSLWCSGRARPGRAMRRALLIAYGIRPEAWGPLTEAWERRQGYRTTTLGRVGAKRVAERAGVDVVTVRAYLDGRSVPGSRFVKHSTRARIELALLALGLPDLVWGAS